MLKKEQRQELDRCFAFKLFGKARCMARDWGFTLFRVVGKSPPEGAEVVFSNPESGTEGLTAYFAVVRTNKDENFAVNDRVRLVNRDTSDYEFFVDELGTVSSLTGGWVVVDWDCPREGLPSYQHLRELEKVER